MMEIYIYISVYTHYNPFIMSVVIHDACIDVHLHEILPFALKRVISSSPP